MMLRAILFSVAVLLAAGTVRGQAPATCGNVYVDAQFVLSGAGWLNVQGNAAAWAALPGALVSDLASLLGRAPEQIAIGSIAANSNSLTVVFTARSNALAEAARIAALIRDDVPASAPLSNTLNVYSSVGGQSSADVSVASHTATSRDVFDSTCADSSNGNEITTAAPYTSSSPNEVTTPAPYTSSNPNELTTPAPTGLCGWVYIDAQFVLSGAGWLNVQGNAAAWAALPGALVSDLASLLGRAPEQIAIGSIAANSNSLTVVFTARSNALAEAARIAALIRDDVPASAPLPNTLNVYSSVGGQSSADVSVASHTATSRDVFDSTCADSSNGNEITTAAPYTSSSPNEVTTPAPYTSSNPHEVTTEAPYTSSSPHEVTTTCPPPVPTYARANRFAKAAAVEAFESSASSRLWTLCAVVGFAATAVFMV